MAARVDCAGAPPEPPARGALEAAAPERPPEGAKGHWQLAVRGCTSAAQAALTLLLVASGDDLAHNCLLTCCQMLSSATLFTQWRTGSPWMFVCRSIPSFVRCGLSLHEAVCGRCWFWDACDTEGWEDARHIFRVLHICAAVRMLLNGSSLVLQFLFPQRGVTVRHGNEQLFYRGFVRALGIPLHLSRGVLKLTVLTGTQFERSTLEVAVNFGRCLPISVASWSLWHQWRDTGVDPLLEAGARQAPAEDFFPSQLSTHQTSVVSISEESESSSSEDSP